MDGKAVTGAQGQNGLFASAVKDGNFVYIKVANTSTRKMTVDFNFTGLGKKDTGLNAVKRIVLKSDHIYDDNTVDNPEAIVPVESEFTGNGKSISARIPALSFTIFVFEK